MTDVRTDQIIQALTEIGAMMEDASAIAIADARLDEAYVITAALNVFEAIDDIRHKASEIHELTSSGS